MVVVVVASSRIVPGRHRVAPIFVSDMGVEGSVRLRDVRRYVVVVVIDG